MTPRSRRSLLVLCAGLLGCDRTFAPLPDVVLISLDTTRADHTSVHGYERDTTPRLRALARDGMRFDLAYAPTSTTAPTHASVFTGLHPVAHRVVKNGISLGGQFDTLAERFGRAGYQTAAFVSSFVLDARFGFAQGFETYDDDFELATATIREADFEAHSVTEGFDRRGSATTERAAAWLRQRRDPERPLLLFVHYFDPHRPYAPPPPFDARFADAGPGDPVGRRVDRYDGEVAFADHAVGLLLAAVDPAALVIVFGDHGEGLMQHQHMGHGVNIYEEAVRVPFIWRWPGRIPAGQASAAPVTVVDVLPTLIDLLGLSVAEPFHGESLAAGLTEGRLEDADRIIFLQRRHYDPTRVEQTDVRGEQFGVRVGDWKYVVAPDEGTEELYNLADDPAEADDLRAVRPDRAAALAAHLDARLRDRATATESPRVPESVRDRLRALGYTH